MMPGDWTIPVGPVFLLLGFALVLGLLAVLIRLFAPRHEADYRKREFLSPAERSFLGVLSQAADDDWRVFAKVRIADVLTPAKGMSRSRWQSAFNAISAKHFDFLLCDPADCKPTLTVELDDKSHDKPSRRRRDRQVEAACASAGLRLIRVKAARTYQIAEIRDQIREAMTPKSDPDRPSAVPAERKGRREPTFAPMRENGGHKAER